MKNTKLTSVDLFAGAGGFSLAAQESGYEVVFAIENDKHAATTYRNNICAGPHHSTVLYEEDISTLDPDALKSKHFAKDKRCDLLLGGPPCQGFSTHRIRNAGVDDPRNQLIHTYFSFVKALRPCLFLMENVPGILWPRHKSYLDQFYEMGRQAGYQIHEPIILDARDFGVPQRRQRVFILGIADDMELEDFHWPISPTHGNQREIENNPSLEHWIPCGEIFRNLPEDDTNGIHMNHTPELVEVFSGTPKNGGSRRDSGRILPCHRNHDGHKDVYGRINPFEPAPTMTTACINPSKGRFVHPTENHGITARQAARIQTFPDHFNFAGGLTAAGKQIGNAVPVKLGTALVRHIRSRLFKLPSLNSIQKQTPDQLRKCA